MDISRDDKWGIQLNQIGLTNKYLLTLFNQHFYLLFGQVYGLYSKVRLVRFDVVSNFKQGIDDIVYLAMVGLAQGIISTILHSSGGRCPGLPALI